MRILRLDLGRSLGTLDLHPFVTVVSELSREQGDTMAEAIRSIVRGSSRGVRGLVESDGDLIELGGDADDRLHLATTEDIIIALHELVDGDASVVALEAQLDQLKRAADLDAVYLEQIRASLEPTSAAEAYRLREILNGNMIPGVSQHTIERAEELRRSLDRADALPPNIGIVPDEVVEMSALWDTYKEEESQARRHLDLLTDRVTEAEQALGDAMHDKLVAEAEAVPILLSPEDDHRLDELVNPSGGSKRRKRSKGANRPEVDAEIQELLDSVGFPTYTAYVMHRLNPQPPAEKQECLQAVTMQVEKAHAALDEARAELEIDPVASQLAAALAGVKEAAREYLGPVLPDDIGAVLADIVNYEVNPEWVAAVADVRASMTRAGIRFDEEADESQISAIASDWLSDVDAQIAAAEEIDTDVVEVQLEEAEDRFRRHSKAMARIDRLEAKAFESHETARGLADQIERIRSGTGSAADLLLARLRPRVDRILGDSGGPVPIICWGEMDDLSDNDLVQLLEGIQSLSHRIQVVYVADSARIRDWAENVGLRRAMCSSVMRVAS